MSGVVQSKYFFQFYVLCGCLVVLCGCGYQFQGSGSALPPDVKFIAIPRVENITAEPGLSTVLTEALRDEFDRYGAVTVVENESQADAVLRTRLISVVRNTDTVTSTTDAALELSTSLTLAGELRRRSGGVLWRNDAVVVSKSFGADSGVVVTSSADFAGGSLGSQDLGSLDTREVSRSQEQEALVELADRAARTIYQEAVAPEF
jgi:outer membrane lipopolysaccharide assembly protein LptE/RlpB